MTFIVLRLDMLIIRRLELDEIEIIVLFHVDNQRKFEEFDENQFHERLNSSWI